MAKAGMLVSNLSGEAEYKSFRPAPLPPYIEMDAEMIAALTGATRAIATLDTLSSYIPNMNLFVSMYVRKEALLSSQIEGTQATLEDVLDPLIEKNANQNVSDVINYIKATEYALNRLSDLPLCNRLIKETHAVLMNGVRGQEKNPGEFRVSQNWIGAAGSTLKTARYIPPCPEDMVQAMSDLEKYMNAEDDLDVLIQAALIHYQFEIIHPFLDGNGRVGRLMITLLFLRAIKESAEDASDTVLKLSKLHEKNAEIINGMGRAAKTGSRLFFYLEQNLIIDIRKTSDELGLAYSTVSATVNRFAEESILAQTNNASRNRVFAYTEYLDILRKDT